jgi:hypothetical protein
MTTREICIELIQLQEAFDEWASDLETRGISMSWQLWLVDIVCDLVGFPRGEKRECIPDTFYDQFVSGKFHPRHAEQFVDYITQQAEATKRQ